MVFWVTSRQPNYKDLLMKEDEIDFKDLESNMFVTDRGFKHIDEDRGENMMYILKEEYSQMTTNVRWLNKSIPR